MFSLNIFLLINLIYFCQLSSSSIVSISDGVKDGKGYTINRRNDSLAVSLLTIKVNNLEKELEQFKIETNTKIQQLMEERVTVSTFNIRPVESDPDPVTEKSADTSVHVIDNATVVIKKHRFPTASWAFLYDEPGDHLPLFVFNENREDHVGCLTFKKGKVDEIDTHGTCVILYNEQACTGRSKMFQTQGRQPIDEYNLSIEPCAPQDSPIRNSNPEANSQIPFAFLYSKFDSVSPSVLYNQLRQISPSCLSYEDKEGSVNAINTFGTCVYMYTGSDCMGYRTEIQTSHRMKVPSEMEDNNLSIGPCYAVADIHDKVRLEGTPVQIFDSRKDGSCLTVDVKVQSMNTHDTCVRLYSTLDCQGESHMVKPRTSTHWEIPKNFNQIIRSIGPCYS